MEDEVFMHNRWREYTIVNESEDERIGVYPLDRLQQRHKSISFQRKRNDPNKSHPYLCYTLYGTSVPTSLMLWANRLIVSSVVFILTTTLKNFPFTPGA